MIMIHPFITCFFFRTSLGAMVPRFSTPGGPSPEPLRLGALRAAACAAAEPRAETGVPRRDGGESLEKHGFFWVVSWISIGFSWDFDGFF